MNEEKHVPVSSRIGNWDANINFYAEKSLVEVTLSRTPTIKINKFPIFDGPDLDNAKWIHEMKKGKLPAHVAEAIAKETGASPEEVQKLYADAIADPETNTALNDVNRAMRILTALTNFETYFDVKRTSVCADKLSVHGHFFAVEAPEADVDRLTLYAFNGRYYSRNGAQVVARELERIRDGMLKVVDRVHNLYDPVIQHTLKREKVDKNLSMAMLQALNSRPNCEIKTTFRREVCISLAARNMVPPEDLNRPPRGCLFAVAVKNGLLRGNVKDGQLNLELREFTPAVKTTRQLNVEFTVDSLAEAAKWFDYTKTVLGGSGAFQFYQHAGFALVTTYPLPTERTGHIIVGDPNTGKGTHIAAVESVFRNGSDTFYSTTTPHKLTDPREHFSRQSLANKMLIIHGDIPHTTIRDYSEVNALLGGEASEMEKKFRDPTVETPTLKVLWASAAPLHRVKQPGGAYRRFLLNETRHIGKEDRALKPRMLRPEALNGFFLNMLTGLATLYKNGWMYTNEPSTAEIEEKWNYLSDSVGIFISENLTPSVDSVEVGVIYEEYERWCRNKQIQPVPEKTFTTRLKNYGKDEPLYKFERKQQEGRRALWIFAEIAGDSPSEKLTNEDAQNDNATSFFSWEAFVSGFPAIKTEVALLHGQVTRMRENEKEDDVHARTCIGCPNDKATGQNVAGQRAIKAPPVKKQSGIIISGESGNPGEHDHHNEDTLNANPAKTDTGNKTEDNASLITPNIKNSLKTHDPGHTAELTADPLKSNAQSETQPITEKDGKLIADQLLGLGYHLDPDTGPNIDRKYYKIGVPRLRSLPSDKREKLEYIMQQEHFTLFNSGSMGIFWYIRPLIDGTKEGAPHD